ncbi:HrpE/YscL family type III secretion apparatus protein [Mesorhizobium sp. M6A.T.Cr.TU.014.01.1.1]|nr:type III secretion system stator protein SctL [Mesorhizobium sp.]RVB80771.1 HrpE/YscL family type III secretion apparatus protein [Mesorhizobium sp. M6A.T.Cr.TU.014.01.1.1]RWQ06474.1 MAG: HrpE/YscL family type III secretion apparatus protein [Mesorhizobium sp.]RWQ11108.1 MAG: HrpE/YscL family type III secretion apparatus protein [Mesorhizobium sp.]
MASEAATNQDLPTRPRGVILRAAEAAAWCDGYAFLEAARREADQLRDAARKVYASEYAQGYEDGIAAGSTEAARLVSETAVKVDRYLGTLEQEVIDLALDVVQRMLGEFDVTTLVAKAARQAVAEVRRAKYLKISVHPNAVAVVRDELDAVLRDSDVGFTIEINADSKLAEGTCLVTTDVAVVDASIDAQLAAITSAVAGKERA